MVEVGPEAADRVTDETEVEGALFVEFGGLGGGEEREEDVAFYPGLKMKRVVFVDRTDRETIRGTGHS